MAAGIEMVPDVSRSPRPPSVIPLPGLAHFHEVGGCLHQAEDEIAAVGFARRRDSYAGKTAVHHHLRTGAGPQDRVHRPGRDGGGARWWWWSCSAGDRAPGLPTQSGAGRAVARDPFGAPGDDPEDRPRRRHHRGVLPLRDPGPPAGRDLPRPGDPADRRQPGHGCSSRSPPQAQDRLDGASRSTSPLGQESVRPLRLGPGDRPLPAARPRTARRRVRAHRAGPRRVPARWPTSPPINQRAMAMRSRKLLTLRQAPLKPPEGLRRRRRRSAGRRLGLHPRRDRGGGGSCPPRRRTVSPR